MSNPHPQRYAKRQPKQWWLEHWKAWQSSGLSKARYYTQNDINLSSFSNWTKHFSQQNLRSTSGQAQAAFIQATIEPPSSDTGRVQSLSVDGVRVEFEQAIGVDTLRQWIRELRSC